MFELARLQEHGHAVVHFRHELVRLADDHRTRLQALTRFAVLPFVPQTRDREHWRPVTCCEIPGLLALRRVLPLVIARYRHEATLALERLAEERLGRHGLDAGIEGRGTQLLERLAPPERHQTPSHFNELALAFRLNNRVCQIGGTGIETRLVR